MIERIDIAGVHFKPDEKLEKYVSKKIGKLSKYIGRVDKKTVHAEVKLKESRAKERKQCTCDVILYLPKERMSASETTLNMYAAVDIVEAKLQSQLKKYKDKRHEHHTSHKEKKIRKFLGKIVPRRHK
jgi:putative sigma-54 modulation protein